MKTSTAPVEKKAAATIVGALTGIVTWMLVTFVPSFHHGLPAPLATFLPMILGTAVATGAAWQAKHSPREEEVLEAAMRHLQSSGLLAALPPGLSADVAAGAADLERLVSRPVAASRGGAGGAGAYPVQTVPLTPQVSVQGPAVAAPVHPDDE